MAPPTKATPAVIERVRFALENGATLRVAALLADISVRTLHRWIKRGIRPDACAIHALAREVVHQTRRLDGVDLVRTPHGLAFRRRGVRRPHLPAQSLLRALEPFRDVAEEDAG